MDAGIRQDWPNVDLGHMPNEQFLRRVFRLLGALPLLLSQRKTIGRADVIIARNVDLLALAWLSRFVLPGQRARLVYECLDIHGLMTRPGPIGQAMRFVERFLLKRVDLLWTSSPGFLRHYFEPVQKYDGPSHVIENKLWFETPFPRPKKQDRVRSKDHFTLGWVGSIRCSVSLELLARIADKLGPSIEIAVHGGVHRHAVPEFDEVLGRYDNIVHYGPYRYPDDLARIYLGCDAVWAQDLWQRGGNSDWLLPNRIYEAGWFGCPCIAVAGTETGRRVQSDQLGYVVDTATPDALLSLFSRQDRNAFLEISNRLFEAPESNFRLAPSDVAVALHAIPGSTSENVAFGQSDSTLKTPSR